MSLFTIPPRPPRGYTITAVKGTQHIHLQRFVTSEALRAASRLRALGWTVTVTS